ncbi:acyltransferase family protein [Sphingobacterium lumbrici]|uniref:acyltransferase family protein n=1 Tax=Sphingobacterium lumbrici TaxID=2559600 RepID=UPI001127B57D|nr:acyltransferase [Sphingobacterium lumbrici]
MEQRKYLDILQVYRGIAALVVVIHHTIPSILFFNKIDCPSLLQISALGKLGVDFFFVLSGFIIAYTNLGKPVEVRDYLLKRTMRIYVPYLPIGIAILVLYLVLPQISASDREFNILNSLTLFPIGKPALSVAWSLSYEMFFYLIFIVCILSRKWFHILVFLWSALIFISLGMDIKLNSFLLSFYILEFFIGYALAYGIIFDKRYVYFVILTLTAIVNYFILPHPVFNITIALAFSLLIFVSINFRNFRLYNTNIFMLIGACSYSVYLLHNPLQAFLVRKLTFIPTEYVIIVVMLVVLACSLVAGYIYYRIFEKNLTKKVLEKLN